MRDWQELVREQLNGRGLTATQQDEVVAELAAHLEDLYEEQRACGGNESDAIRRALDEVVDWRQLSRMIRCSKRQEGQIMNDRTRSLWLPGLASLTAAMGTLMIINQIGLQPRIFWYGSLAVVQMYVPWLAVLPVFGALGAYLSRRANGKLKARLAAASFPALVLLGLFCPAIVLATVLEHHLTWSVLLVAFSAMVFNWVLLPGAALLVGALPFLRSSEKRGPEQASC